MSSLTQRLHPARYALLALNTLIVSGDGYDGIDGGAVLDCFRKSHVPAPKPANGFLLKHPKMRAPAGHKDHYVAHLADILEEKVNLRNKEDRRCALAYRVMCDIQGALKATLPRPEQKPTPNLAKKPAVAEAPKAAKTVEPKSEPSKPAPKEQRLLSEDEIRRLHADIPPEYHQLLAAVFTRRLKRERRQHEEWNVVSLMALLDSLGLLLKPRPAVAQPPKAAETVEPKPELTADNAPQSSKPPPKRLSEPPKAQSEKDEDAPRSKRPKAKRRAQRENREDYEVDGSHAETTAAESETVQSPASGTEKPSTIAPTHKVVANAPVELTPADPKQVQAFLARFSRRPTKRAA